MIKIADVSRFVGFFAYDSTDHITPKSGLSSFTVDYFLNSGTSVTMTTPTVTEKDATDMPGWYTLAIDESGMVSAEGDLHLAIKATGMDNVAMTIEIIGNTVKEVYDQIGTKLTDILNDVTGLNGETMRGTDQALLTKDAPLNVEMNTTIDYIINQTKIKLSDGGYGDGLYNHMTIIIYDVSNYNKPCVRKVTTYEQMNKYVYLDSAPDFTMAVGDGIRIIKGSNIANLALASDLSVSYIHEATISSISDQTNFYLDSGSVSNDLYNHMTIIIYDVSNNNEPCVRKVTDWDGTLKQIKIDSAPDFTMAAGDTVKIIASTNLDIPTVTEIRTEIEDTGSKLSNVLDDVTGLNGEAMRGTNSAALATNMTSAFTEIKGSTWAAGTDTLEALRDRGDAAYTTATGFSIPNEYDTVIAALQTDLDNPNQYKADITNLDVAISTRSSHTAANVWSVTTRSLTDKVDFALSTSGIKAIWDQLTSGLTTVGSLGKLLVDNINATISSRNAIAPNTVIPDVAGTAATLHGTTDGKIDAMDVIVDAIKAKTDNLPSGITKGEALPKFDFFIVLNDHITAAIGKTITGVIMKDGGGFAAITNVISEVSHGMYTISSGFTDTEMNGDVITLKFDGDGCDTRIITILTT